MPVEITNPVESGNRSPPAQLQKPIDHDSLRVIGSIPTPIMDKIEFQRLFSIVKIGMDKMDFQSQGLGEPDRKNLEGAKKAYQDFIFSAYGLLTSSGASGGFGWSGEKAKLALSEGRVNELVSDMTSIIWSNFDYGETTSLVHSFMPGRPSLTDCDLSADICAQLLLMLGIECEIAFVGSYPASDYVGGHNDAGETIWFFINKKQFSHALLKVGGEYFETTTGENGFNSLMHYSSEEALNVHYTARFGAEKFCAGGSLDNYINGNLFYNKGEFQSALGYFEKSLELNPKDALSCDAIGEICEALGDRESAALAYLQGLSLYSAMKKDELSSRMSSAAHRLTLQFGIDELSNRNLDIAAYWFEMHRDIGLMDSSYRAHEDFLAFLGLAKCYLSFGRGDDAVEAITTPRNYWASSLHSRDSDGDLFQSKAALLNDILLKYKRGTMGLSERNKWELYSALSYESDANSGIALIKEWAQEHPQDARAQSRLGLLHFYNNENKEAIDCLNAAISLEPQNVGHKGARCVIYAKMGMLEQAYADLEEANRLGASDDFMPVYGRNAEGMDKLFLATMFYYLARKVHDEYTSEGNELQGLRSAESFLKTASLKHDPGYEPALMMLKEIEAKLAPVKLKEQKALEKAKKLFEQDK